MDDPKRHWTHTAKEIAEIIKDDGFAKNSVIFILLLFVIVGALAMYLKNQLDIDHFLTSLDIAIGIIIGGYLINALKKKKRDDENV